MPLEQRFEGPLDLRRTPEYEGQVLKILIVGERALVSRGRRPGDSMPGQRDGAGGVDRLGDEIGAETLRREQQARRECGNSPLPPIGRPSTRIGIIVRRRRCSAVPRSTGERPPATPCAAMLRSRAGACQCLDVRYLSLAPHGN